MSELQRAFALAVDIANAYPWRHADAGYRLCWVHGRHGGFRDLPARTHDYVVIGRHSACDMVLPADPELSLRHLLARTITLADGTLALRLFDLHSNVPMFLEDGVPRRSIV
jgi:hypothetical protein